MRSQPQGRSNTVLTTAVASHWGFAAVLARGYINSSRHLVWGIMTIQMLQRAIDFLLQWPPTCCRLQSSSACPNLLAELGDFTKTTHDQARPQEISSQSSLCIGECREQDAIPRPCFQNVALASAARAGWLRSLWEHCKITVLSPTHLCCNRKIHPNLARSVATFPN